MQVILAMQHRHITITPTIPLHIFGKTSGMQKVRKPFDQPADFLTLETVALNSSRPA